MIMKNVTLQEHVCVRIRPTWVKFCSLVSQFVKVSLIILSCAELTSAPEAHLPAQAPASPTADRLCNTTPVLVFGFPPQLIPNEKHLSMFP